MRLDTPPDDVRRLHREVGKRAPVEANRMLTALSAVFGWADRAELIPAGTNPVRYVERFAETGTRRALTQEELEALGVVGSPDSGPRRGGGRAAEDR